jgi:hypothetical protein
MTVQDLITMTDIPSTRLYVLTEGKAHYNFNIKTLIKLIKDKLYDTDNPFTRQVIKKSIIDDIITKFNKFSLYKIPTMLELHAHYMWWNDEQEEIIYYYDYYTESYTYFNYTIVQYKIQKIVTWCAYLIKH